MGFDPRVTMAAIVSMQIAEMTEDELLAIRMAVLLDMNPTGRLGHDKVKNLFTENNGTKMHQDTKSLFMAASALKLGL